MIGKCALTFRPEGYDRSVPISENKASFKVETFPQFSRLVRLHDRLLCCDLRGPSANSQINCTIFFCHNGWGSRKRKYTNVPRNLPHSRIRLLHRSKNSLADRPCALLPPYHPPEIRSPVSANG